MVVVGSWMVDRGSWIVAGWWLVAACMYARRTHEADNGLYCSHNTWHMISLRAAATARFAHNPTTSRSTQAFISSFLSPTSSISHPLVSHSRISHRYLSWDVPPHIIHCISCRTPCHSACSTTHHTPHFFFQPHAGQHVLHVFQTKYTYHFVR